MSSFLCPVCIGSRIKCYKCEISSLKLQVNILEEQLRFLKCESSEEIKVSVDKLVKVKTVIHSYHQETPLYEGKIELGLSNTYFITLTFDPERFGINNTQEEEEGYILYTLYKLTKRYSIFNIYGCFEEFKTGITHSHLIIHTNEIDQVIRYLRTCFTYNPRNRVAVNYGPAHETKSIEYINKKNDGHKDYHLKGYFVYGDMYKIEGDNPLDYGLD